MMLKASAMWIHQAENPEKKAKDEPYHALMFKGQKKGKGERRNLGKHSHRGQRWDISQKQERH